MNHEHKCDMFCLWEDLDHKYKQCKKCLHNKLHEGLHTPKNNRIDGFEHETHLWKNNKHLKHYNEYKDWLERTL